jgi:hypothetical protein
MTKKKEQEQEKISQVPGSLQDGSFKIPTDVTAVPADETIPGNAVPTDAPEPGNVTPTDETTSKDMAAVDPLATPGTTDPKKTEEVIPDRDPEMQISEHISYREATESETADKLGVKNDPPDEILEVMKVTAAKMFEPLRRFWKCMIAITSFYRSPEVNAALSKDKTVKASKNSQHMSGEAMDIDAQVYGNISNRQVFEYLRDNTIFDQLIWERGDDNEPDWVHVSYKQGANRMQVRRSYVSGSRIYYEELNAGAGNL